MSTEVDPKDLLYLIGLKEVERFLAEKRSQDAEAKWETLIQEKTTHPERWTKTQDG